ncbi:AMP-binding protein [Planosporangium sp. 12N6]|uniref:AMP-binding protein n=1 Tax=Planosporangium spinosum TaxID=3402278 RepID=UPI003CEBFEC7
MNLPVAVHTPDQEKTYRESGAWPQFTLADKVRQWASERPDSLAVVDGTDGREVTFGRLCVDASRVAGWLRDQGIGAGDGVSVQLPNRYETVVMYTAASMVGARLNPLLPNYRRRELSHFLRVSRARVYVTPAVYRGFDHAALAAELLDELDNSFIHVVVDQEAHGHDAVSLSDLLGSAPLETFPVVSPAAVSELIFTSGTESQPKAVMHTEETVNHSARASYDHLGLTVGDVVWMPSPVGHSTGFNFGVRLALIHGLPVVLQDRWEASRAAELIEKHRCTYTLAASTFLTDLLRAAREDGRDISSMRFFGCGGAPVASELVREAASIGVNVLRIYGSTEGLIISWNQISSPRSKREGTDGLPPEQTSVAVWDDDGRPLGMNEVGELAVKGPNVCVGFFDDPVRTAATFTPDGWLRSGDLGVVDEDGYVTVVGRKKETIIRGGLNIAPREIEDVLVEMPGVRDVAVVGVADPRLGEIVGVYLVPEPPAQPTLEDVVAYLSAREMAKYKLPQYIQLIDELPRTPTGKVRKTELATRANQERSASRDDAAH